MIDDFYANSFERWTNAPAVTFPYDLTPTLIGTFAGGITKLNGNEQWLDDKMTMHATHRIYCPTATVVELPDTIKLGTRSFLVRDVDYIDIHTGHHCEVLVDEVK